MSLETWELLSYIVTVIALPVAIVVFLFEQPLKVALAGPISVPRCRNSCRAKTPASSAMSNR
jgi:hypothetical protein